MDSRSGNIQYRSVPLIQRGDFARFGTAVPDVRRDTARESDVPPTERRPLREVAPERDDSSSRRSRRDRGEERGRPRRRSAAEDGAAWERSASVEESPARAPREHVSAYMDESSVVRVTRRGERRQRVADDQARAVREPRGERRFTLVTDEMASMADRPTASRRRDPERTETRTRVAARDRMSYDEDYDYYPDAISGSASRRQAIVDGLRVVPEAIGSAVLGALSHVRLNGLMVLAVLALTATMLYVPVRDLYLANRRLDTLQETYDALLAENDQIRNELEVLQTREGIENEARARGYVEPGETKVVVEGLDLGEGDAATAYTITDLELPDNRPWYIRILDDIFGYDPEA